MLPLPRKCSRRRSPSLPTSTRASMAGERPAAGSGGGGGGSGGVARPPPWFTGGWLPVAGGEPAAGAPGGGGGGAGGGDPGGSGEPGVFKGRGQTLGALSALHECDPARCLTAAP
jgi:hypothetical protein